jgi:hypothetical protein
MATIAKHTLMMKIKKRALKIEILLTPTLAGIIGLEITGSTEPLVYNTCTKNFIHTIHRFILIVQPCVNK